MNIAGIGFTKFLLDNHDAFAIYLKSEMPYIVYIVYAFVFVVGYQKREQRTWLSGNSLN